MTAVVKHTKVSGVADSTDTSLVRASDWNNSHQIAWGFAVPNLQTIDSSFGTSGDTYWSNVLASMHMKDNGGDPWWDYVVNYISFAGYENATTFKESKYGNDLTSTGAGAYISQAPSRFGTGCLNLTAQTAYATKVSTDYALTNADNAFIEVSIYPTATPSGAWIILDNQSRYGVHNCNWQITMDGSYFYVVVGNIAAGSETVIQYAPPAMSAFINTWTHLAVAKVGTRFYLLINGKIVKAGAVVMTMASMAAEYISIGSYTLCPATYNFKGYIQDFRFTKGVSRYHPEFDVLEIAAAATTNTKLLCKFDGVNNQTTFADSSSNNYAINRFGNAVISTTKSKFGGSSLYLDGSASYLSTTYNAFGTSDCMIEAWVYLNAMPTVDTWPTNWANTMSVAGVGTASGTDGFSLVIGATTLFIVNSDAQYAVGTHLIVPGFWYHVCGMRIGTQLLTFCNGRLIGAATAFSATAGAGAFTWIGSETGQGSYFNGYIDDLRIQIGSIPDEYLQKFTTPAATYPVKRQDLEERYNGVWAPSSNSGDPYPRITTKRSKYQSASLQFHRIGWWAYQTPIIPATGPFQIQFWINFQCIAYRKDILCQYNSSVDGRMSLYLNNAQQIEFFLGKSGSDLLIHTGTVALDYWHHVAVSRDSSNDFRLFLDGTLAATANSTQAVLQVNSVLGCLYNYLDASKSGYMYGFMEDLRVYNVAKNIASFTPPTTVTPDAATVTLPSGYNYSSAGPIIVADGVIVEVPNGSTWVIV